MATPRLKHTVAALVGFFSFALAFAAPVKFDIPAQPAPAALKVFIKQSNQQVVFNPADLESVSANEVKGEFEPALALDTLLKGTGFSATKGKGGIFMVKKAEAPITTGSVRGVLTGEGGKGMPNVLISIRETAESAETNRFGEYVFPKVAAGTYVLVASAGGYQTMHIADVQVRAGRDLTIGKEEMRKAKEGPLALEPFVVHAATVEELEKFEVTGVKQKPFTTANVDIPRTINDAQPYYIFDAKTIDQSGAVNVETFLKQRLTMNTSAFTSSQNAQSLNGNTSSIDLRGLGADKTLILINGRRIAGVTREGTTSQPDLNGLPLSAIDRIEVLPSSASGIYGGSAIGGVVNVVLKTNYVGAELRATYDNTWNTDAPSRTLAASFGMMLEGGKTQLLLNAQWTDARPLLLQDRRGIYENNLATLLRNSPTWLSSNGSVLLGSTTNIRSEDLSPLVLKNGVSLNSSITHVAPGTAPTTSAIARAGSLLANAGTWDLSLPLTTQTPTGLMRPFGSTPETRSFHASAHRQFFPGLKLFADFSYNTNRSKSVSSNLLTVSQRLPSTSPASPFAGNVDVQIPDATAVPLSTESASRSITVGANIQLPFSWTAELDYTWSENRFKYSFFDYDVLALRADLASGAIDPLVDTLLHPLSLEKYRIPTKYAGSNNLDDYAMRASGPLPSLPWGKPNLTVGLERRIAKTPQNIKDQIYPITTGLDNRQIQFARTQSTDSGYGEVTIPVIKEGWLPALRLLELQLAGRTERYTVDTGTRSQSIDLATGTSTFGAPTLNGQPYYSQTSYTSTNGTMGVKYQPVESVTLRVSRATAFLPPLPNQLVKNPLPNANLSNVTDPTNGLRYGVQVISGGNPDLLPQSSESSNLGIVWEPRSKGLKGLRLNLEYYRIEQDNAISSLSAQQIVTLESTYSERVTRDAAGRITLVDISSVNLYKRDTSGIDLSVDYSFRTGFGNFRVNASGSMILHLKNQYSKTLPEYEGAGFHPGESGAPKHKGNLSLNWERQRWTAGWTARYFGSYKTLGAAGGPNSVQNFNGAPITRFLVAQGSEAIPSQTYHDFFASYSFGGEKKRGKVSVASMLSNVTLQMGVRNILNKVPPFDVGYDGNYFLSPYGDMELRSYWISLRKTF